MALPSPPSVIGRYTLFEEIASGGMATVFYGRLDAAVGVSRTVAVKRLHPHFAKDPEFARMFLDEARLAARISHPNVVPTLDVVAHEGELLLVMEYVRGASLHQLLALVQRDGDRVPLDIASAILCGVLHGLHAAHEATSDRGEPLAIVHRDVSPQNVLVGADGIARVLDFGVAKAVGRLQTTQTGNVKGKLGYMSPEQLRSQSVDRRTDVFAAGILLWETLTGERLFRADNDGATVHRVLELEVERPSALVPGLPRAVDEVVMRALERTPAKRFVTAREMALALEAAVGVASASKVASWLEGIATDILSVQARAFAHVEERASAVQEVTATIPDAEPSVRSVSVPNARGLPIASGQGRTSRSRVLGYALVAMIAGTAGVAASRLGGSRPPPTTGSAPASASAGPELSATVSAPEEPPSAPSAGPVTPSAVAVSPPAPTARPHAGADPKSPRPAVHMPPRKPPCVPSYVDDAGIKQYRSCP